MSAHVGCERGEIAHVGRIVLRRPEASNAFSIAMVEAFVAALTELEADDAVKVIVIAGEGAHLTRGFDPAEAEAIYLRAPGGSSRKVPSQRARLLALDRLWWGPQGLFGRLMHCPKITILAAKGLCHEVGLHLALCCDLVFAATGARFANPRWRHVGVDGDISMLVAAVGLKRAKDLMFLGIEWPARDALRYGLVDAVVDEGELDATVRKTAALCTQVMRDGIIAEKHVVFASLAKMHIGLGFATATAVGAWASNVHFRPGEFNFLREARNAGVEAALAAAERHFSDTAE
jgi:enoyl-CoA hydratase/carnithine racemase